MSIKIKSKPDAIGKMLGDDVEYLPAVATAFYTLVSAKPEARAELADKLHDLEEEADKSYLKVIRKVADTFITPYDREDLYEMIEAIDDVIDHLDHAAHLLVSFEMGKMPEEFVDSCKQLVGMCEQARDAVGLLKKPSKLEKVMFAINDHENALDKNYRKMLTDALQPGSDPIYAIKLRILAEELEQTATKVEKFSRTLAVAAIKET